MFIATTPTIATFETMAPSVPVRRENASNTRWDRAASSHASRASVRAALKGTTVSV